MSLLLYNQSIGNKMEILLLKRHFLSQARLENISQDLHFKQGNTYLKHLKLKKNKY